MTLQSKMSNSKRNMTLPDSIRNFVERQATLPLGSLFEDSEKPFYPYCEYWHRGRICGGLTLDLSSHIMAVLINRAMIITVAVVARCQAIIQIHLLATRLN
jgi:hypothetical protein